MQNESNNSATGRSAVDRYLPNGSSNGYASPSAAASQGLFNFSTLRAILWHQWQIEALMQDPDVPDV